MEEDDKIKSGINSAGKHNPFAVPDGYFESFPSRLRDHLEAAPPVTVSVGDRVWQVIRPQLALVAVIAGFAIIGYLGFHGIIQTEDKWLSNDNIAKYMNFYNYEFSESYLLSMLEDNGLQFDDEPLFDDKGYFYDLDAYLDYLYQENINIDLIITALN